MLKKTIAFLLSIILIISLCGCSDKKSSESEKQPKILKGRITEIPDYSLNENATADDMRQMAVKAMRDELSVQWYPEIDFKYMKMGTCADKIYKFSSKKIYCGLPYTNGDSSLLHWLSFYDFKTGMLDKSIMTSDFYRSFGNACATSAMWAWNAVCTDIKWDSCKNMTPQNGCIPVKGYNYPEHILDYLTTSTKSICKENGEQKMFEAYANLLPGDIVDTYSFEEEDDYNHVMMVTEKPHVLYFADGSINPVESYVLIQDQRSGSTNFYPPYLKLEDKEFHQYSGRIDQKVSFNFLYKSCYIPLSCAWFTGEKNYEKAVASFEGKTPESFNDLALSVIRSNYKIVSVKATVKEKKSKKTVATENYVRINNWWDRSEDKSVEKEYATTYMLNNSKDGFIKNILSKLRRGKTYQTKIDVLLATGETITVLQSEIVNN